MKKVIQLSLAFFLLIGCAKIPMQSIELADALMEEGARMHNINLAFVNSIFNTKRAEVNAFVEKEYTPALVANFTKLIPATTVNVKDDLPGMIKHLVPEINLRKDSLLNGLQQQKDKLVAKLNSDYKAFENAAGTLKRFLVSAVKVDKEKADLYNSVKGLSKNKVDLSQIEKILDNYVQAAGSAGNKVNDLATQLEPYLNQMK